MSDKVLLNNFNGLDLKDVWWLSNKSVEYTFVRQDYGSRLDRIYVKNLSKYVRNVKINHVNFSDHSCIQMEIHIPNTPKIGKFYWKLNVSLLDNTNIKELFIKEWEKLKLSVKNYNNLNDWWEKCAKKGIKNFFIKQGKIENQKKYGMLK